MTEVDAYQRNLDLQKNSIHIFGLKKPNKPLTGHPKLSPCVVTRSSIDEDPHDGFNLKKPRVTKYTGGPRVPPKRQGVPCAFLSAICMPRFTQTPPLVKTKRPRAQPGSTTIMYRWPLYKYSPSKLFYIIFLPFKSSVLTRKTRARESAPVNAVISQIRGGIPQGLIKNSEYANFIECVENNRVVGCRSCEKEAPGTKEIL